MNSSFPVYSEKAQQNISMFYNSYQTYHFHIEDQKIETINAFQTILNTLFKDKAKIERVFSLKNKLGVIKAAKENTNPQNYYIIDRDLDPYLEEYTSFEEMVNIIELKKYCFENYLIDKKAFVAFMNLIVYDDERKQLDLFDKWFTEIIIDLIEIFKIGIVARKHCLKGCITDREYNYLKQNEYKVDKDKLNMLYNEKKQELEELGISLDEELVEVNELIKNESPEKIVSGKFLWASLNRFFKNHAKMHSAGSGLTDKSLFTGFILSLDLSQFQFILDEVN